MSRSPPERTATTHAISCPTLSMFSFVFRRSSPLESGCKDTTFFHSRKIFFHVFPIFYPNTLSVSGKNFHLFYARTPKRPRKTPFGTPFSPKIDPPEAVKKLIYTQVIVALLFILHFNNMPYHIYCWVTATWQACGSHGKRAASACLRALPAPCPPLLPSFFTSGSEKGSSWKRLWQD